MWKTKYQIVKKAISTYKIVNKNTVYVMPYKKHKNGITNFMKACKRLQKYNPSLYIHSDSTSYEVRDYKNISRFIIWYDYDDDIEDNENFYSFVKYKEIPEGEDTKNFMYLKKLKDLKAFIKETFTKEK